MTPRPRFVLPLLTILLLVVGAGESVASEDAGARSAFAAGAGVRALSMGGAFGAIADDASASIWNPAGLSQLQRNELLLSHASLYGLGFSEQYAFLVMPSWRLGNFGVAFRHLGVDGVEGRDASNVLVSDDLTRSEWELGLAYSHALGDAWSLGFTGKVQSLSFAGYSDQGLGLDLGLLGRPLLALGIHSPWSQRVRVGLAVRNLLEPSITLDQESVPDPTGVRVGSSVMVPMGASRGLLLGFDIEKTQDMDTRLHTGLEIRLHSLFSISAGYSHGALTAGTGVQWRDIGVQYTLENNDFDTVQRIGVSMRFGSSIFQRKQNALAAEEEALRDRLDQEFQQRQIERVRELVQSARQAQAEGRFEEGLEYLDTADALEPDQSEVRSLRAAMQRQLGESEEREGDLVDAAMHYTRAFELDPQDVAARQGAERCHGELQRRAARSAELRAEFEAALDAFAADDLGVARAGFERIVAAQPEDAEAAAMLERTQLRIDQRTTQWIEQAQRYGRGGRFDAAEELLAQVEQLEPEAAQLEGARTTLVRQRAEAEAEAAAVAMAMAAAASKDPEPSDPNAAAIPAVVTAPAGPPARTPSEEKELEDLYARGLTAMKEGRASEAVRYWEVVWSKDPDYQQVRSHLKQEYVLRGMQLFASRQLDEAIDVWEDALRVDPGDERTMSYLNRARMQLDRAEEIRTRRGR